MVSIVTIKFQPSILDTYSDIHLDLFEILFVISL